jgi:hypothetical protein
LFQQSLLLGFATAIVIGVIIALTTFPFNMVSNQNNSVILSLLPLAFIATYSLFNSFRSDRQVITPKNIMLFIWLNKLVIIPIELIIIGNKVPIFEIKSQVIVVETNIILCAFMGFVIGWSFNQVKYKVKPVKEQQNNKQKNLKCKSIEIQTVTDYKQIPHRRSDLLKLVPNGENKSLTIYLSIFYIAIGLLSIIAIYGSFQAYFTGAWLTYITKEAIEKATGNTTGYLANVGQRFLPFGIILAWIWWTGCFNKSWIVNVFFLTICFLSTLSSNRSNMIYPILTFTSVLFINWQIKNKIWLLSGAFGLLFLSFFFGFVRVQTNINSEQVGLLFNSYTSDNDYLWYAHQVYFGSPYQITPLLHIPPTNHSMLWASILDPVPIVGRFFREQSGPFIYNLTIYDSTISQDKTIPVAGELFYEGGYLLVVITHFLIGWIYAKLDLIFKQNIAQNLPIAIGVFYLALLFNATLLLSISVLVQFLIYNAAPALFILVYERLTRRTYLRP